MVALLLVGSDAVVAAKPAVFVGVFGAASDVGGVAEAERVRSDITAGSVGLVLVDDAGESWTCRCRWGSRLLPELPHRPMLSPVETGCPMVTATVAFDHEVDGAPLIGEGGPVMVDQRANTARNRAWANSGRLAGVRGSVTNWVLSRPAPAGPIATSGTGRIGIVSASYR